MKKSKPALLRLVVVRLCLVLPLMLAIIFWPAGTFNYWEAWVFLAILFIPAGFVFVYLSKNSPDLLERRMKMKEEQTQQKKIIKIANLVIVLAFILPGFDKRFGWSDVPVWLVICADVCALLGYALVIWVFRTNRYASRVVEVSAAQQVISSGPYAVVRHPMYVGVILLYGAGPLALGSYWALLPGLVIIPVLAARIIAEEDLLVKDLAGYADYRQRVRWRLIPGIW